MFLDDDPERGRAFLASHPHAVWVQTAQECIACLSEPWDEVHLDHDLGGEAFVNPERDDCGMAVIRWLSAHPRIKFKKTRFFVHTHNLNAACLMGVHLEVMGYEVEVRPFGAAPEQLARSGRLEVIASRLVRSLQAMMTRSSRRGSGVRRDRPLFQTGVRRRRTALE